MNNSVLIVLCLIVCYFGFGYAQNGKDVVQRLYEQREKCKEPFGSNWVPLPDGLKCGGTVCEYPKNWCAIRSKGGIPDLFCEPLDPSCQEALKEGKKPEVKLLSKASAEEEEEKTTKRPKTTTNAAAPADDGDQDNGARSSIPCEDFHDVCCFWAASGECTRNPNWMKRTCRKSCGVCDCSPSNVDLCQPRVRVDQSCKWLFPNSINIAGPPASSGDFNLGGDGTTRLLLPLPPIVGGPPPPPARPATPVGVPPPPGLTGPSSTTCQDRQPLCRIWASTGQCERNPRFMVVNCRLSCGLC